MGIKIKNLDHLPLVLSLPGIATAAADKDVIQVPFNGWLAGINAVCSSGGSGATNSIIDINYCGTTIFSAATKVTIASTTGVVTYSALTTDPLPVTTGATMSMDVDSISTNLSGVKITLTFSRRPPGATLVAGDLSTLY